jgi:cytochrome c-type biogenesis protein CcmH
VITSVVGLAALGDLAGSAKGLMRPRLWLGLALLLFAASAPLSAMATPLPGALSTPADESRARSLQKEFRCLVCQGQSLDESEAPLAADLRQLIRQRIKAGDTNPQIERYLVVRYGNFILMEPPFEPSTYGLWLAPLAVLVLGLLIAMSVIFRARARAKGQ